MAAANACEAIKARLTEVAAQHFAVPAGDIAFSSNRIYAGNRSLSFAELASLAWERRVSLLKSESIDPDMLDERARSLLNYADPRDLTLRLKQP